MLLVSESVIKAHFYTLWRFSVFKKMPQRHAVINELSARFQTTSWCTAKCNCRAVIITYCIYIKITPIYVLYCIGSRCAVHIFNPILHRHTESILKWAFGCIESCLRIHTVCNSMCTLFLTRSLEMLFLTRKCSLLVLSQALCKLHVYFHNAAESTCRSNSHSLIDQTAKTCTCSIWLSWPTLNND